MAQTTSSDKITKPEPKSPVVVFDTRWEPGSRNVNVLTRSELLTVLLHRWESGGEIALHHHTDGDATWIVMEGEVTFYGEKDEVIAKASRGEGVLVPRNTAYWFQNTGDEPLSMFRVAARVGGAQGGTDDRVYHKRD